MFYVPFRKKHFAKPQDASRRILVANELRVVGSLKVGVCDLGFRVAAKIHEPTPYR